MNNGGEMKKKSIWIAIISIIVVISVVAIIFVVKGSKTNSVGMEEGVSTESENKVPVVIEFTYYEDYWQKYDLTNAVYKTQAEYETAVRSYIDQIATLVNRPDWYQRFEGIDTINIVLKINDADDGISPGLIGYSKNNKKTTLICDLNFSNTMFKHNRSQLVHALTDLVVSRSQANIFSMLEQGFCEYIQSDLGMGNGSSIYGLDIHNYVKEFTKKNGEDAALNSRMSQIRDSVGDISKYNTYGGSAKNRFEYNYVIVCNNSFVDYLVKTYGIEGVMKMLEGYDESIYYLLNQNGLSGLVSDWEQFVETYPSKLPWDEIDAQITELKSTYGY